MPSWLQGSTCCLFFYPLAVIPFHAFFFFLLLFYFLSFFFSYSIRDFNITYTQIFIYEYPPWELLQLITMWGCSFWQFLQTRMLGSWRKIFWRNLYIRRNEGILHRNNQVVIRHKKSVSWLLCSARTSEDIKQRPSDTEAKYYHILATPKHQVHH